MQDLERIQRIFGEEEDWFVKGSLLVVEKVGNGLASNAEGKALAVAGLNNQRQSLRQPNQRRERTLEEQIALMLQRGRCWLGKVGTHLKKAQLFCSGISTLAATGLGGGN